jgi:hypothetical protein
MSLPLFDKPQDYVLNLVTMRSSEAKRLHRQAILEKWNYHCCYCGDVFPSEKLTLDHIRPKSRGGSSLTNNLVPSCAPCNRKKGTSNWIEFMRSTFGCQPEREQLIYSWIRI